LVKRRIDFRRLGYCVAQYLDSTDIEPTKAATELMQPGNDLVEMHPDRLRRNRARVLLPFEN